MCSRRWVGAIKKTLKASEQGREDVARARREWQETQKSLALGQLVFIDESSAKTNLTRLYGRGPRDRRVYDSAPGSGWNTTTMLSSLRLDGSTACLSIAGAIDRLAFREYVRQVLVPNLKAGDIVILDNFSTHKDPEALALFEQVGVQVKFLPPYSPDLNPIEKMWSKVKAILRQIKARTQEALEKAIAKALAAVTPQDAQAWFKSCGYEFN